MLTDEDFLSLPDAPFAELAGLLEPDSLDDPFLDSEPPEAVPPDSEPPEAEPFVLADDDSLPASLPALTVLGLFRLSVR